MSGFDLAEYWSLFGSALEERYRRRDRFKDGFARIEALYQQVRPGRRCRDLTVDDVLEIFRDDLPYVEDWSKPDRDDLARRMGEHHVAELIRRLENDSDGTQLVGDIRYCLRDLGLTALVLRHVYPRRFAMCSHHLASLLFVRGRTVPEFYVNYCGELLAWSRRSERRNPKLNVVESDDRKVSPEDATTIVNSVSAFIGHNTPR